ncbi:MAG: sulfite exporter TauE/SafE family protein [Rhodobiaceae bacterium]|nr:sulfite exporter TauE/SafE family protein [Rhodobiaceae bacterium]MCC0052996.1 sulfite exporter TauE/SafE family protein [Rhodobiaceae bacterium]
MIDLLPPDIPALSAAIMIVSSFFTSLIMAATGFGGGVLLLSIMASLMPIAALIPVHGVVQLGSNTGRVFLLRQSVQWGYLLPFLAGSIIGAAVGGKMVVTLSDTVLRTGLALFILYMVWGPKPKFIAAGARWMVVAGGAFSTFLTMFFGATGPFVLAIFSNIFPDNRLHFIATHSSAMVIQHVLKVLAFGLLGFAFAPWAGLIVAMIATGFAGTWTGTRLLHRIPEAQFRIVFKLLITAVAAHLLWQGLSRGDWI